MDHRQPVVTVAGRPYQWQDRVFDDPRSRGRAHRDVSVLADGRVVMNHPDGTGDGLRPPFSRVIEW